MESENTPAPNLSNFKLTKNSKGYNWEVKIYTDNLTEMQEKIKYMEQWANANYGGVEDE